MKIIGNLLRKRSPQPGANRDYRSPAPVRKQISPPLILLLPDAGGIATYRLFRFDSIIGAERFVDSHLRGQIPGDTVVFWATDHRTGASTEALVLIKGKHPGSAHAISFTDLDGANEFVREQVRNGLALGDVMVHWVAPAKLQIDPMGYARISAAPRRWDREVAAPVEQSPTVNGARIAAEPVIRVFESASPVISFAESARRLRSSCDTAPWWRNMVDALDEALDAFVARNVTDRLVWRHLSREVGSAAALHESHQQAAGPEPSASDHSGDTGDDSWFIPRREWREPTEGPFRGFGSPPDRF